MHRCGEVVVSPSCTREALEILQRAAQSQDGDLRFLALAGLRQLKKAPRTTVRRVRRMAVTRKGRAA